MKKTRSPFIRSLFAALNQEVKNFKLENTNTANQKNINRRTFLNRSSLGMVGLGVSMSLPSLLTSCKTSSNQPNASNNSNVLDIAILGGGMAGLNCANHLLNSGLNFKIFEASKRLGGRILTHYNDSMQLGIFPEFGGDFVDSDHEDMIQLAKEFKLQLFDMIDEQEKNNWVKDIYFFDNRKISEAEVIKEFKKIVPQLVKDTESLGENYDTEDAVRLDNLPLSDYLKKLPCAQWLKDLLDAAFIAEFGLDCKDQSTINMLDIIDTDTSEGFKVFGSSDERYRIIGGNSKVIENLAKKIGEDKILVNHQVNAITELEDGTYSVSFDNNEVVQAKAIVCTIPFTILRNLKLELKNMSAQKRKCIDELGYGNNTKLVLAYDGQPWRSKQNNAMGYLFTKEMTNGWDSSLSKTDNNPNGAYVVFFGGDFSQKMADESFSSPMAPPWHIWKTQLSDGRINDFVSRLDKIFVGSKDKFLNKHVFVNWIEYPWVKASYSCYKPGQWTSIAGLEAEPVGNFFFAGEHCSEMFQGFMNGAAESGRKVAEAFLQKVSVNR